MDEVQKLLEDIVKAIVNYPEEVKTEREVDEMGVLLHVWVDRRDMGLVIGRGGNNIEAIKYIIKLVGYKTKSSIAIKIEEPKR